MLGTTRNTFLAYLTLALTVSIVQASGDFPHVRRDHVQLKRIIKKRGPAPQRADSLSPGPAIGAGRDPADTPPESFSASASASSILVSSVTTSATPSSTTGAGPLLGGLIPVPSVLSLSNVLGLGPSSVSASSSSVSLSASSTSSSSTSSESTSTQPPTEVLNLTAAPTSTPPSAKPTVTETVEDQSAESTTIPKPTGAAQTKSTTLMILIIIASSIGGIAILWTVFRKWKLGRSSKFDERLQPIDWQPTDDRDDGIIPAHRRAPSNASSFHSGSGHANAMGGYGSTSDHGHPGYNRAQPTLQPIPDHDFTAGPAPVGGYADLARGPSPPMSEAMNRGPSATRPYDYDGGVPLHHQVGGGAYAAYEYQGSRY